MQCILKLYIIGSILLIKVKSKATLFQFVLCMVKFLFES